MISLIRNINLVISQQLHNASLVHEALWTVDCIDFLKIYLFRNMICKCTALPSD